MTNTTTLNLTAINALRWITKLLTQLKIPYQITGGLAAKFYGTKRELADLDIDIPNRSFNLLLPHIAPFITFGPARLQNASWDILLATLVYEGQEIDLCGVDDGKIFNSIHQKWVMCEANLSTAVEGMIEDIACKIIEKQSLINYKSILNREVDRLDILAIEQSV